jgi:DNA replication protein DnaC
MTNPIDRRGGQPLRMGDAMPEFLRRIRARLAAGTIGMTPEQEAEYQREQEQRAADELAHRRRIQQQFLSSRHIGDARRIQRGELRPIWPIYRKLRQAPKSTPLASVLLVGDTEAGKTTAATAYALDRIDAGWTVRHRQASRFAEVATNQTLRHELEQVDLLILDELHRPLPDWIMTALVGVIDERYQGERQTIGILTAADTTGILGAEVVRRFDVQLVSETEQERREE